MRSEKVKILSYQNAYNYGAILQAYGLQKAVERLGFLDVSFINYFPSYLKSHYSVFPKGWFVPPTKTIRGFISYYINLPFWIVNKYRRYKSMDRSRRRMLNQSGPELNTIKDFKGIECDYLICGSDQIWSTWITGVPDPVFYAGGDYKKLICALAYAPSTELSTFSDIQNIETMKKLLGNFKYLSAREEAVQRKLIDLTGRDVCWCVDPTILCGAESFKNIASKKLVNNKYVLLYTYGEHPLINEVINRIPDNDQLEIHIVSFGASGRWTLSSRKTHAEISVEDFLSYFLYASYVITNSFHGLAFSLLFRREFLVLYEESKSARCESLLHRVGCDSRMVKCVDDIRWTKVDFTEVHKNLENMRKDSENYLKKCLNC